MDLILPVVLSVVLSGAERPGEFLLGSKFEASLGRELLTSETGEWHRVYFVVGPRLGLEHWYPRVQRMALAERRKFVISESQTHAASTQREVIAALQIAEMRGDVLSFDSNWVGNFVTCVARAEIVAAISELPSVLEVWPDRVPLVSEVEDELQGVALPPGNAPLDTRADLVWGLGVTGAGVLICNVDAGANLAHGDLINRRWFNAAEIPGNSIDDDNNGYADDVNGWNFISSNNTLDDGGGHGTRTAGLMVADGSCNGTTYGQAPGAQLMTARIASEVHQWNAVQYALTMGADLQTSSYSYKNNSFPVPNYAMHRDVAETSLSAGLIRTNSSSNNGGDCATPTSVLRRPFNISCPSNVPSPYRDPNQTLVGRLGGVLAVGAHDAFGGALLSYSPCGPTAWDLADLLAVLPAYNQANWDTVNDNDYPWSGGTSIGLIKPDITGPTNVTTASGSGTCGSGVFTGTSAATPVVAGVIALWKSANPSLTPEDAAMIAHQTAMASGTVNGKEDGYGAGHIDAYAGLQLAICVHRVDGSSAWKVEHSVSSSVELEIDTLPNTNCLFAFGYSRSPSQPAGGIGDPYFILMTGTSDANGDLAITVSIPPSLSGYSLFTEAAIGDYTLFGTPLAPALVVSNVVEVAFVP